LTPRPWAVVTKLLPGVNLETYLVEQRIEVTWNTAGTGVEDATKAFAAAVQAKEFATLRAYLQVMRRRAAQAAVRGGRRTGHGECRRQQRGAGSVQSPRRGAGGGHQFADAVLIWWRVSGRQRFNEIIKAEP